MPLQLDPEVAAAFAPLAKLIASRPQLPRGDVLGRRKRSNTMMAQMMSTLPDYPSVTRTNHSIKSFDGTYITIAEFRKQGTSPSSPPPLHDEEKSSSSNNNSKALYHIHGGGMILGSVDIFSPSTAQRCEETGLPIFAVEYRLAPEHPHPTPVGDCWAGLQWLSRNAVRLGVDARKIVVVGESAGGGLAAGTCLLARDEKLSPPVAKQILIFPMLDDRTNHDSNESTLRDIDAVATWKLDDNATGWEALLGDQAGSSDTQAVSEYAAPARAEDLSGLPPTYIDCGQLDIFIREDTKFASRLMDARVPTEFHTYPGMPHAYMIYAPDARYSKMHAQNVLNAIEMV
ncbi:Carboxylesterase NlhH [Sphaerulina musiva]